MPEEQQHYDTIIIGTGQGGIPLAKVLAEAGQKVAIIEKDDVGGSCVNYGCTPTKTLLASAQTAHMARRAAEYGVHVPEVQVNMQEVKQRRDKMVLQSRKNNEVGLEDSKAVLLRGTASFLDKKKIEVKSDGSATQALTADRIIINTGAAPSVPAIEGIDSIEHLNHKTIQDLTVAPEHLLILGGGYIGLEFGQMFRRFGSKVTIVQHGAQLLSREDEDVATELKKILEEEGINILLDTEPQQITKEGNSIKLKVKSKGSQQQEITASHLLLATGVKANTADLDLEKAGIETDKKGNIKTDKHLHTSAENVYAIGDVKGGPQFTHISYDDYRILRDSLLHGKHRSTDDRPIPYCVFTDPQLGRVGLSEKQAKEQEIKYKIAKLEMSKVARGEETGHTKGFMKVLVNEENEQILGAAILAAEGGEIMTALQIAMMGKLSYKQLKEGVFAHPTYLEALNNLFMKMDG
ncbi:mercuric reductase [Pontibacter diazotrophicus]|uniref:Mercuric reductase n=1 Tax=Pontibacter diazotrophicus TaxID=1400979 RepID=A0A3D8LHW4_9BACT|nr:mercuric reductase [Pontibacter diazotrophicus]RDV17033.1 mercuric reductase [Pontibacter diazotrophicus]